MPNPYDIRYGRGHRPHPQVEQERNRMEFSVAEGDDLGSILKVEPDRRAGFACPPQEETRSAIAFHLWRESGNFHNR